MLSLRNDKAHQESPVSRWLMDLSVIQVLEDKKLKKSDFIVTENYNIRLGESASRLLLEKIVLNFNKRAQFRGEFHTHDNVMLENIRLLAKFLENGEKALDFEIPEIKPYRNDDIELHNWIISLTPEDRKRLKISKSTLRYSQKAINGRKRINMCIETKMRIE